MEKRRLGKTENMSSIIIFGSAALCEVPQAEADAAIELAFEHGMNLSTNMRRLIKAYGTL